MAKPNSNMSSSVSSGSEYHQSATDVTLESMDLSLSPFLDTDHPIKTYELLKMLVMFPVALLRGILAIVILVLTCTACMLVTYRESAMERGEPFSAWRKKVAGVIVSICARIFLFNAGFYWITVTGGDNLVHARKINSILVYNHVSYCDAAMLMAFFQSSGIAKSGVATIPFVGKIAVAMQYLFITRKGSMDSANKYTLMMAPQEAVIKRASTNGFPLLALAPEATTKSKDCLLRFRKGAFVPGKPVTPILFRYPCNHFHCGWGLPFSTLFHVWRLLSQFVNYCEVKILPPYYPSEEEKSNPILYAQNVRSTMANELSVPIVDQGIREEHILKEHGIKTNWRGNHILIPHEIQSESKVIQKKGI